MAHNDPNAPQLTTEALLRGPSPLNPSRPRADARKRRAAEEVRIENSLAQRIADGALARSRRIITPNFVGGSSEASEINNDDIFGWWLNPDGEWEWMTWGEALGPDVFNINQDNIGTLTQRELDKLRSDLIARTGGQVVARPPDDEVLAGSVSRGRGRGAAAPTFVPQDSSLVREQVQNYVIATTGTANETLINQGVSTFQSQDRAAFNSSKTQGIDPWQAMKETVRASSAYKAIHANRPDSVDEMKWVTGRQAKLRQLGVSDIIAEELGIGAAISGASDDALVDSASVAQVQSTGRLLDTQRNELKQQAKAVAGLV